MHSRFLAGVIDCLTAYRCNGFVLRWDVQSVDGTAATIMARTTDRTRAHGVGRGGADGEGRHTGAHPVQIGVELITGRRVQHEQ